MGFVPSVLYCKGDDSHCTPELPRQKGKWGSERVLRWGR